MRIIGGSAKGRTLAVPKHGTRPMTGRAKESIFSIMAPRLGGVTVLDLYAGSGALGLEALSRGALDATFIEGDPRAVDLLRENIARVGLGGRLVRGWLPEAITSLDGAFDVAFVDPPYPASDEHVRDVLASLDAVLSPGAVVVVHRQASATLLPVEFLTCTDQRHYGDAVVTMMERPIL